MARSPSSSYWGPPTGERPIGSDWDRSMPESCSNHSSMSLGKNVVYADLLLRRRFIHDPPITRAHVDLYVLHARQQATQLFFGIVILSDLVLDALGIDPHPIGIRISGLLDKLASKALHEHVVRHEYSR